MIVAETRVSTKNTTIMKEKIEEFLKNNEDKREARASLMFIVCYNLLDDNCPYTSGQIREMIMDALDNIEE